jgi:hypothetical protein
MWQIEAVTPIALRPKALLVRTAPSEYRGASAEPNALSYA